MTKICKVSVEKPRKSSRTTKSPFKLNEKDTKINDPIILLSDPSSDEKLNSDMDHNDDNDYDDFISAYYSEDETEKEVGSKNDEDPHGEAAYLKLKGILEEFLSDFTSIESDIEEDGREREYVIEYRAEGHSNGEADNHNINRNTNNDNYINTNNTNIPPFDNPLLMESDFIEMIEGLSQILIMKYILKVLNYVRKLQLTSENQKIKKRIAIFFKYIEDMPDSEIRKDCDDLRNDLVELNGGKELENFPQSGVILIDLIDGSNNGLSSEDLSKLSSHKYSGPTQNKCCICMSDVEDGDDVIKLKRCAHEYHATCIVSWLKISNQCPICRDVVN